MSAYAFSAGVALQVCAKTTLPKVPLGHVIRSRLRQRLLAENCRLRLMVAPAGFGKSVLLADCARECPPERTVIWLNCAGASWSSDELCLQLSSALGYSHDLSADQLLRAIAAERRKLWIILDDYAREPNELLDNHLDRLIGSASDSIGWWLTSRRRPQCNLPRLLLEGELFELGGNELVFSYEELCEWLGNIDAPHLAHAAQLFELCAGWPAAMRLLHLAASHSRYESPLELSSSCSVLLDYIEHEVLTGLDADLRQALLQLAQLSHFNAELCEHVLGVGEGANWLQALRIRGLFIQPMDDHGDWFELFAPLAAQLRHCSSRAPATAIHLHASQWFAVNGDIPSAVEHALSAGQPEVAASFLERFTEENLLQGKDIGLILRWREDLPEDLLMSTPRLVVLNAWILLLAGRLDEAGECSAALARFQPQPEPERTTEFFAQWQALKGVEACSRVQSDQAIKHLQQALQWLPESAWAQALICRSVLTQIAIGEGRLDEAQQLGYEALKLARSCGSAVFEALLELDHALLLEVRGEFVRAQALLGRVRDQYQHQALRKTPVWGRIHLRLGRLAIRQRQLDKARALLRTALNEALEYGDPGAFYSYLAMAELAASEDDISGAFALLAEAERLMQRHRVADTLYRGVLLLASSQLWIWQGHRKRARQALTRVLAYHKREQGMLPPQYYPELIVRLRYSLLNVDLGEGEDVRGPVRQMLDEVTAQGRLAVACELWSLLARACEVMDDTAGEMQARQQLRELMARLNYQGLWSQRGEAVAEVVSGPAENLLSSRELAVLKLIAQGCSNQEVADQLFISLHTVKTHARRINGKLGVARRTQAVASAKAQGLL
ncbi:LuxR C-terminal-related transcriptional regulator [Pseudomonas sp. EL_65y_Pfl2_R95]|uniref:LuxR C-terminal-related transcriptional regulator n=1 Tax=Pseudomonas sp. EL_65y_Pfl2_R95 TaxID=3088698 RepID=UPI0030DA5471